MIGIVFDTEVNISSAEVIKFQTGSFIDDSGSTINGRTVMWLHMTSPSLRQSLWLDVDLDIDNLLEMRKAISRHIRKRRMIDAHIQEDKKASQVTWLAAIATDV